MIKLWIMLAVSLVIAILIDQNDRDLLRRGKGHKDRFFTCILILVLACFCGLRINGNDTATYVNAYEQIPRWEQYARSESAYDYTDGIGFGMTMSIMKTLGFSSQDFLMFFAFAATIPYILFMRRFSGSMVFCVFLMFTTGVYTFTLAAIKQTTATAFCLLAVMAAVDKKWIRYLLLVGLGAMFHPYAIVYLFVPLMMFKPWTYKTFLWMAIFMAAGFFLESLLGTVLDITDMMGASYDEESFTQAGVNIFRVIVCFVPMILAALYGKQLFANSTEADDLMFNLAMINALIMFVGLFGTANYFARLANYFLPAQVIVLPWILRKASSRDREWLVTTCVVCYLGYFYYAQGILYPFSRVYKFTSLWEYLPDLFS